MQVRRIDPAVWRQHIWQNRLQSLLLLGGMAGFLGLLGWLLWGPDGILMLITLGLVGAIFNPAISPRLVMRLYGASPIHPRQAPDIRRAVEWLSHRSELPAQPELYYLPSSMLNAFAVGTRENSAIAVTDGLLRAMNLRELVGVLAHEISHIRNNDLWIMGLADMFTRATALLSYIGQFLLLLNLPLVMLSPVGINWLAILLLIFAPTFNALAQLALSRTREYNADLNAARLTGDPEGLATALARLEQAQGGWWERIFMPGRRVPDPSLLRTHPSTEERIRRLMELKPKVPGPDAGLFGPEAFDAHPEVSYPRIHRRPRWHLNGLWY